MATLWAEPAAPTADAARNRGTEAATPWGDTLTAGGAV
ncbi:hypothetical protein FHR33_002246 [Nonomuraea dietziae]|uniref:Uncharacterized protein n=1 Tax=Nonomuraea dietziae TaxID=65515 RepID=A0A7W5V280_9ACTN|nr:hypothetical protein [Nonomuraea dietziae]